MLKEGVRQFGPGQWEVIRQHMPGLRWVQARVLHAVQYDLLPALGPTWCTLICHRLALPPHLLAAHLPPFWLLSCRRRSGVQLKDKVRLAGGWGLPEPQLPFVPRVTYTRDTSLLPAGGLIVAPTSLL